MNESKQTIKILLATGLYPPEIGGPATYAQMLEELLPKHGYTLNVQPYGKVRHLSKLIRHTAYAWLLFKESKDVDVIYALDPVSVGVPAWLVSLVRRKPLVVRLGGDYAWEQGQQRFGLSVTLDEFTHNRRLGSLPVRLLSMLQSFVTRRAKRVIVPSNYLKNIVMTWGVKESQLEVIYSALFPLVVAESKATLREQLSFEDFVVVSVGRLVPWKGFEALLNVMSDFKSEGLPISLIIAGDGPQEARLKQVVKEKLLEDWVRMVGRLSKDALGAVIKASDCFVLNTGYEGLSHQLLEVMDLGVPIITTHVGGNPELIVDGFSGFLVDFNDEAAIASTIKRFKENEALRLKLTQNARARTHDFAQEKVVADLAQLIRAEVVK